MGVIVFIAGRSASSAFERRHLESTPTTTARCKPGDAVAAAAIAQQQQQQLAQFLGAA
jgi:hypothetical protein